MRLARDQRGQATVEMVLGLIVFVTVLLFGIHFAEAGWMSIKVQEAGAYAVWEATGRKVEDLKTSSVAPISSTFGGGNAVDTLATAAYRDFNGQTGTNGSAVIVQALTKGKNLQVQCSPESALSFPPSTTAGIVYRDTGGLRCQAEAQVEAFRIPSFFLDDANGLFNTPHRRPLVMRFCAVGKASGGSCPASIGILTNDWGLSGDAEADACNMGMGGTCDYGEIVQRLWSSPGTAARDFALKYAGTPGTDETVYYFSYKGVEDNYVNWVGGEGKPDFNTGGPGQPSYYVPARTGHDCFLGMGGSGCP